MASPASATPDAPAITLPRALELIAARAAELDAAPRFPSESFEALAAAGVPQLAADRTRCGLIEEVALVRAVAAADASTARILDGHFNGVERLALCAPEPVRTAELEAVGRGELLVGVWGADPRPAEGAPARIERTPAGRVVLRGVKTFCSGAGGVQRALVVAREEGGGRRVAYVNVEDSVRIDAGWYRASGLRASESHRVEFCATPVLALLGGEGELMREPWFSRDAVRTASTWAGIADCIVSCTVHVLGAAEPDQLQLLALGRMRVALASIDRWLDHASARLRHAQTPGEGAGARPTDPRSLAAECRVAIAEACRVIAAEAARACGSRALVDGGALDRARRDLDLFLLQHRLEPKLLELGALTLEGDGA